jgi:hypothetical protein
MNDSKIVHFLPYAHGKGHIKKLSPERKCEYINKETDDLLRITKDIINDEIASYKASGGIGQDLQRDIQNALVCHQIELTTTFPERLSKETGLSVDEVLMQITKHLFK